MCEISVSSPREIHSKVIQNCSHFSMSFVLIFIYFMLYFSFIFRCSFQLFFNVPKNYNFYTLIYNQETA